MAPQMLNHSGHSAIHDDHRLRSRTALRAHGFDLFHNIHAFDDSAKDDMLAVEVGRLTCAHEELAAICVRACVRHGQAPATRVLACLSGEAFVGELSTVDRLTATAVPACEVPTLAHEARDDTVERGPLEVERLALCSHSLFAGAQAPEV